MLHADLERGPLLQYSISQNTVLTGWVWRAAEDIVGTMKLTNEFEETKMVRTAVLQRMNSPLSWFCAGLLTIGGVVSAGAYQTETSAQASAQPHQAQSNTRVFASDAGIVLNFIKPEKTADFEAVVAKLHEALQKNDKPERKQQAATWKVFRANEPGANGSVLYVFTIDPVVKGADYTVSTILAEAFPTEVQALYKSYAEAYASGQNYVNLKLVAALGDSNVASERSGN
jgi:hypothetical protein